MKTIIYLLSFVIFLSVNLNAQNQMSNLNLMPYPKEVKLSNKKFRVDEDIKVAVIQKSKRIVKYSNRFLKRIANRTGLFMKNPFVENYVKNDSASIIFEYDTVSEIRLGIDESYNLSISEKKVFLKAKTDIGIMHGIETLLQLLSIDKDGYYLPGVRIKDEPRFSWRGLMIDACRHFMPVDVIKRNLDAMAAVKMNVFHWHLSEDQGFRIESKVFPKLHLLGSDGLYYTQEQIKDVVKYAEDRGIRVVPEIDIPGHATAMITAYPELASFPGQYSIERNWGVFNPTLNPTDPKVYEFLEKLFAELTSLFPDKYFHIGGDENNGKQWEKNQKIQKFMKKNNIKNKYQLQSYFNNNVLKILTALDKNMIGWDEILQPEMPKSILIQSWRGVKFLKSSAKQGYKSILSNGYYIDLNHSTDKHYIVDPIPDSLNLSEEEEKNILGGEATMWAEFVSEENIDSRIWPRTAAIAERFWSPKKINDVDNMYERLDRINYLLEEHGLLHIKNVDMMLRRLTNNQCTKELAILVSVIEPVKNYRRNALRKHTQQSPLTRVVDCATPDAKEARIFRQQIKSLIASNFKNEQLFKSITAKLELWKGNHKKLIPIIKKSPILNEIIPMSINLKQISELALKIINSKSSNVVFDDLFFNESKKIIKKSEKAVAQTELMILTPVKQLLNSVK